LDRGDLFVVVLDRYALGRIRAGPVLEVLVAAGAGRQDRGYRASCAADPRPVEHGAEGMFAGPAVALVILALTRPGLEVHEVLPAVLGAARHEECIGTHPDLHRAPLQIGSEAAGFAGRWWCGYGRLDGVHWGSFPFGLGSGEWASPAGPFPFLCPYVTIDDNIMQTLW
jgi:hypothetical protein